MRTPTEPDAPRTVGRYTLFGEIASGGMATVHLGRLNGPVGFTKTVAIKRLHPHLAKDPEFVAMLLDEARVAARVRHPNVVQTLDVVAADDEVFLVMEYVTGESLARLLKRADTAHAEIPPRIAAAIVSSVLHGLHAAHEAVGERGEPLGIVHRDVSPQNVIVGLDGIVRVLDFGVAKAAGRLQQTREGELKGKLAYMAPEQLDGGAVTRRCDIYAAGILFWEALVGEHLFRAETEAATLAKAADAHVPAPSGVRKGLDASFDDIVLRALAREPGRRYPTAREMALDIERSVAVATPSEVAEWVDGLLGEDARTRTEVLGTPPSMAPTNREGGDRLPSLQKRRAKVARTALSVSTAIAIAVGAFALKSVRHRGGMDVQTAQDPVSPPPATEPSSAPPAAAQSAPDLGPSEETAPPPVPPKRPSPGGGRLPHASDPHAAVGTHPRPSCDPPFLTDEKGHRHYKAECL